MNLSMRSYEFLAILVILGKGQARAQIFACLASRSTADKRDQFEIT